MFEWALNMEQEREPVGAVTLDRNTQGEVVATSAMASLCATMYGAFLAFQADRLSMCAGLFFLARNIVAGAALLGAPPTR